MACFPHDGPAPVASNVVVEALGAFNVAYDRLAWAFLQDCARKDDHQFITPYYPLVFVHRADPVRIAIIRDADPRPGSLYGRLQVAHVFRHSRIRVMV